MLRIGFAKDIEFVVDDAGNLMVQRGNDWNRTKEILLIGPLTDHLIENMQGCLDRLKIHAN